ncbi:nucleoid occlusion protein [Propionispora vibrioides]|jgi:ParB family chromosome partitioning protein|uniref:ParB family protein n=1 Tax=Propionispora vibrioides TaxID=112903 RepID=A0A1H8XKP9_9FIRM|nr:nucleoid occlusion protein [Propionispora vibrioides]SEP40486.1 ParB family protein [Propionispora vibrioides]
MKLSRFFGLTPEKEAVNPHEDLPAESDEQLEETAAAVAVALPDNKKSHEVLQVDTALIEPNPFQPRKTFYDESLAELSSSIKEFGVIQPLLVRQKTDHSFELIAGERRLRASKLAGLALVPVIVKELTDQEMAELAMIENLQREDLHYLEEAEGFQQLIANFGFTQEELAVRVGKKQSTIANKMRLLKLAEDIRNTLRQENLTERHARALLKLDNYALQQQVLTAVCQKKLNVRETEALIETTNSNISREMSKKGPKQNIVKVIRDVRIFLNTIHNVIGEMKKTGLDIKVDQEQDDDSITIHLRVPKRR